MPSCMGFGRWVHLRTWVLGTMVLASLVCRPAWASDQAEVMFSETLEWSGEPLVLNGTGVRKKFLFKVYSAGLYLPRRAQDVKTIAAMTGSKLIVMKFLRNVDADAIRKAWADGIKNNCEPNCQGFETLVTQINALMTDVKGGEVLELGLDVDSVTVRREQGKDLGVVSGPGYGGMMLRVFLGPRPPTDALKKGLIGVGR